MSRIPARIKLNLECALPQNVKTVSAVYALVHAIASGWRTSRIEVQVGDSGSEKVKDVVPSAVEALKLAHKQYKRSECEVNFFSS